jgi:hypothetical protein
MLKAPANSASGLEIATHVDVMVVRNTSGIGKSGMIGRTGSTRRYARVQTKVPKTARGPSGRKGILAVLAAIGVIAVLAVVMVPIEMSSAHSDNTISGGACSNCHPTLTTSFLTFENLPTSSYTPGGVYTITISITDTNGVGRNAFDLTVSAGTLSSTDSNVEVLGNNTEAHTLEDSVSSWTVVWTAPMSGDVIVETWGVYGGGSRSTSPWEQDVRILSTTAIPEFPALLLPVLGLVGVVVVLAKISKKSK